MRLWGILKKHNKIVAQSVSEVTHSSGWDEAELHRTLESLCREMDLSRPVVLYKHAQEMEKFARTVFRRDDFMESVDFDTFEIELIDDEKKKKKKPEFDTD